MKTIAITQFKSQALQVLAEVAADGEGVIVTKHGNPLVEVIPYTEPKPSAGRLAESLLYEKDIVGPLGEEMWSACK